MVIDTSAVVAILRGEPEQHSLRQALRADQVRLMGAPTVIESGLVLEGRWGDVGRTFLRELMAGLEVEVTGFDVDMADVARDVWRRFGKGNHPAALNYGDCMTYAVAEISGHPILCVGDDFSRTDARLVPLVRA